jgi:hypothetical protein
MTLTIQEQLDWLTSHTTMLWIEQDSTELIVSGSQVAIDRFERDQGNPVSFSESIEPNWQRKFDTLGDQWGTQRQMYRLLYDSMRSYFTSFVGLRMSKIASLGSAQPRSEKIFQGDLATTLLIQMYVSGKKSLDLITRLGLPVGIGFGQKFAETRNKLFEHNQNPNTISDLILDPSFWDLVATKSLLPVYIHTSIEKEYIGYIDYYQDYYDLEQIFINVVEVF